MHSDRSSDVIGIIELDASEDPSRSERRSTTDAQRCSSRFHGLRCQLVRGHHPLHANWDDDSRSVWNAAAAD
jgi:hypothetical protein